MLYIKTASYVDGVKTILSLDSSGQVKSLFVHKNYYCKLNKRGKK